MNPPTYTLELCELGSGQSEAHVVKRFTFDSEFEMRSYAESRPLRNGLFFRRTMAGELENTMEKKSCLGDGVYIEQNYFGQVVLTTSDGLSDTNTIYLEPEVVRAMEKWLQGNAKESP